MNTRTTRHALALAALVAVLTACARGEDPPPAAAAPAARPSVLLITLDTTRADRLGCYGDRRAATPNLDRLAGGGVRFARAVSPAPLTLPSHATMMSGRNPRGHGVRDNALFRLDPATPVLAERFAASGWTTAAFVSAAVLDRITGIGRGFGTFDDDVRSSRGGEEERAAARTTDAAVAAIRTFEAPFFVWVHYYDPHLPYLPPEPFASRFRDRPYDGEIAYVDREIGRLLEAAGAKDGNLLVAVAGDHGESLGEHGESGHGIFVYDVTQRVPMLLAGPGIPEGRVIEETVGLVDLAPTLLALAALEPFGEIDGRDLVPLWTGGSLDRRDYEIESYFPQFSYGWAPLRGLVRESWKYVEAPRPELYDLAEDPGETRDLHEARRDRARELASALAARIEGDVPIPSAMDPGLAEQVRRLASLGYVSGGSGGGSDEVIDPKDGIVWIPDLVAAVAHLEAGRPRECVDPLRRLLARNPTNVPAIMTLGVCYLRSGDPARAATMARKGLEQFPDSERLRLNLANALAASDPAAARAAYERALQLNPRSRTTYLDYATFLAQQRDGAPARGILERARRAGLDDPEIETRFGILLLIAGAHVDASAALSRALALDPAIGRAHEGLAEIAFGNGRYEEAERRLAEALRLDPSARVAKMLAGIRRDRLDDRAGAAEALRRALDLTPPDDPEAGAIRDALRDLQR